MQASSGHTASCILARRDLRLVFSSLRTDASVSAARLESKQDSREKKVFRTHLETSAALQKLR